MLPFGKSVAAVTGREVAPPSLLNSTWLRSGEGGSAPQYSPANSTVLPVGMAMGAVLSLKGAGWPSASVCAIACVLLLRLGRAAVPFRADVQFASAVTQVRFELPRSRIAPLVLVWNRVPNGVVT